MNLSTVNRSLTLLDRLFDPRHATEPLIPPTAGKPKWTHIEKKEHSFINVGALCRNGIPLTALDTYLKALKDTKTLNTHGILICKNGETLAQINFGAHDMSLPRYVYSASKTVTAMAIGVLVDAGALSLEEKIVDLFASYFNPVTKLRLSALTVEHLLTMRSAVTFSEGEAMTDDDWTKCFLGASLSGDIGKTFHYNSLNTYMLSAIVTLKTGKSLFDFARETFFEPLGITDVYWEGCPKGTTIGGWGLYISPADLCKLGSLLFDGTFEGKRYLSETFVHAMTKPQAEVPRTHGAYDYGYQIWTHPQKNIALMNGMFGQNVFLDKKTGITLAVCSGNGELFQQSETYPLTEALLQSIGAPYTATDEEEQALIARIETLSEHRIQPLTTPSPARQGTLAGILTRLFGTKTPDAPQKEEPPHMPQSAAFVNQTFIPTSDLSASLGLLPVILQAVRNHYARGLVSITVGTPENGELPIIWREEEDTHHFSVGLDGMSRRTWLTFGASPYLIDAKGTFTENEEGEPVLRMEILFAETPHTRLVKLFARSDGTFTLLAEETPGEALLAREAMNAKHKAEAHPIIGGVLSKIDDDYLAYRIARTFAPKLGMEIK